MNNHTLIGHLINSVEEHSKFFGIAGVVMGAILVFAYCGIINFYPSGLTIADTLFFLWVVVVFGIYYSAASFTFFAASIFWVTVLAKPINYLINKLPENKGILLPIPKTDWLIVVGGGFLANILILGVSYSKGHSLIFIATALITIGLSYTLIDGLSIKNNSSDKILDSNGKPLKVTPVNVRYVTLVFYGLMYCAPLLFAQIGGGVTRFTFETMGVRQINVTVYMDSSLYKPILESYRRAGMLTNLSCSETCKIENVDILFTSIGENSKIETSGINGKLQFVIPTNTLKLIASLHPKSN